jgi:hypothetical protein
LRIETAMMVWISVVDERARVTVPGLGRNVNRGGTKEGA